MGNCAPTDMETDSYWLNLKLGESRLLYYTNLAPLFPVYELEDDINVGLFLHATSPLPNPPHDPPLPPPISPILFTLHCDLIARKKASRTCSIYPTVYTALITLHNYIANLFNSFRRVGITLTQYPFIQ
jgi:hypothetical protein